ncbi:MAG: hypothetical protein ACI91V_000979, partial [Lentimonas sp.]
FYCEPPDTLAEAARYEKFKDTRHQTKHCSDGCPAVSSKV